MSDNKNIWRNNNSLSSNFKKYPSHALPTHQLLDLPTSALSIKPSTPVNNIIKPSTPVNNIIKSSAPINNIIKPPTPINNVIKPPTPVNNIIKPSTPVNNIIKPSTPVNNIIKPLTPVNKLINVKPTTPNKIILCIPKIIEGDKKLSRMERRKLNAKQVQNNVTKPNIMMTPKQIFTTRTQQNNSCWLPVKTPGPSQMRLIGRTPLGTAMPMPVPSCMPNEKPKIMRPQTSNCYGGGGNVIIRQPSIMDDNTYDKILHATISLNGSTHVSEKMNSISITTKMLHKQYKNSYIDLPNIQGRVTTNTFEQLLSIYENNQVYYQDCIDDGIFDLPTIKEKLTVLENWFMCIIEPMSEENKSDWLNNERNKITKGYSMYCDPELYRYIDPIFPQTKDYLINNIPF